LTLTPEAISASVRPLSPWYAALLNSLHWAFACAPKPNVAPININAKKTGVLRIREFLVRNFHFAMPDFDKETIPHFKFDSMSSVPATMPALPLVPLTLEFAL
jgi:hypothetical protein